MRRRPTIYDGNQPHPHPYVVEDPREAALPESHFVTLDNLLIHYVHHTVSAEATTVVMMHGFSGNLTNFTITPLWSELGQRFNLLAFDRPAWGLSARPVPDRHGAWPTTSGKNPYTYDYSALLLRWMLMELQLWDRPKIILGHSHGGLTTAYILSHNPDLLQQFRGAVFADAPIQKWPVPKGLQKSVVRLPGLSRFLVTHLAWVYGAASNGTGKLGAGFAFHDLPSYLERHPEGMRGWDFTFRVAGWKKAMAEWALVNAAAPTMDLAKLQAIPCLDVRGVHDKVTSVRDGVESEVLTGAQVAFVAAAGHVPFAEQPHDFLLVVEEFLAELGEV